MYIKIKDALGIRFGVRIGNVRAEYNEEKKEIKIHGFLYKRDNYKKNNYEPRIICSFFDKEDRIMSCREGKIFGNFDILDRVPFSFIINEYSNIDWLDTQIIHLSVI